MSDATDMEEMMATEDVYLRLARALGWTELGEDEHGPYGVPPGEDRFRRVPRYGADWQRMGLLVQEMRARGWNFVLSCDLYQRTDAPFLVAFWRLPRLLEQLHTAQDRHAPMAAARAAVEALEAAGDAAMRLPSAW